MFPIIFQDEHFVVAHKPPGLLVHRTRISTERTFMLQQLRNQLGQRVYPIHRLDRPTAGLIVFAFSSESASALGKIFQERRVTKTYLAIVRGYTREEGTIDRPLEKDIDGELQDACSTYKRLSTAELPIPVSRYATARYSLVEVQPQTGRMHQIRRHMEKIRHPILGDRKHGPRHHNRMWREQFDSAQLMLLAWKLTFVHPYTQQAMEFETEPEAEMKRMAGELGWERWK